MTTAADVMTPEVSFVRSDETVVAAARRMRDEGVGALPVCGPDDKLVGMLTDRDITIEVVARGVDPSTIQVGEIAQGEVISAAPDEPILTAVSRMTSYQLRRLPVVENDALVGIIALADLARSLPEPMIGDVLAAISR
jgi:CBS domain-containing protein